MLSDTSLAQIRERAEGTAMTERDISIAFFDRVTLLDAFSAALDENVALREQLAAAEQREQQARHVLELVAEAQPIDDSGTIISLPAITSDVFYEGPPKAGYVIEHARAWLAARAEQRAAAQEAGE